MRRSILVVATIATICAPRLARAGAWYYTWSCSGGCAPDQLAITGVEGPFGSADECENVRSHDARRDQFLAPGNLGNLDSCQEADAPPTPSSSASSSSSPRAAVLARFGLSLVVGPPYRVEDLDGEQRSTGSTIGTELTFVFGGHPALGIELASGFHYSRVTAPYYGPNAKAMMFIPLLMGLTSSPALVHFQAAEVRLDLGLDGGFLFRVGCSECEREMLSDVGLAWQLRGGVDVYMGESRSTGFGFDALVQFGTLGDVHDDLAPTPIAIETPSFLLRVSYLSRNNSGVAW